MVRTWLVVGMAVSFGCSADPGATRTQLDAEGTYACLIDDGVPLCWDTPVRDEVAASPAVPTWVTGVEGVVSLNVDNFGGCVAQADGTAACWSRQDHVATDLGLSDVVTAAGSGFSDTPYISTCAVLTDGQVMCRGDNMLGQLGDGTVDSRDSFGPVVGVTDAVQLGGGSSGWCATSSTGTVSCWGAGTFGTGDWEAADNPTPFLVPGIADAVETHTGINSHCARRHDGSVACWGWKFSGQLGDGAECEVSDPECIDSMPRAVADTSGSAVLGTAYLASCVLQDDSDPLCWGWPVVGDDPVAPTRLALPEPIVDVAGGFYFMCFLGSSGTVYCQEDGAPPTETDL